MTKRTEKKLSVREITSAKPKDKLYRLRDGGGLSLDVRVTGVKVWRYAYRFRDKQKTLTIGHFPDVSLAGARAERDKARDAVARGRDPSIIKKTLENKIIENTFESIALEFLKQKKPEWSKTHYTRLNNYLSNDVYPFIGHRSVSEITAQDIIPIIKVIAKRGAVDAAKRTKQFISQVFDFAVVHGKCSRNPAKDINLKMLLPQTLKKHYAAITKPDELARLLQAIEIYQGGVVVRSALQLAPLVMARPSEVTGAEWREFDFDAALWTIPAKRRKLPTYLKKANRKEDSHLVPLSAQSLQILENLHKYTGTGKYIFPSPKTKTRPLSNNAMRVALRTMGFDNDTITVHGFRGTASTFLNEQGFRTKVIEAQLSHQLKSNVEASYNFAEYLDERRGMLQHWADYLEGLKDGQ